MAGLLTSSGGLGNAVFQAWDTYKNNSSPSPQDEAAAITGVVGAFADALDKYPIIASGLKSAGGISAVLSFKSNVDAYQSATTPADKTAAALGIISYAAGATALIQPETAPVATAISLAAFAGKYAITNSDTVKTAINSGAQSVADLMTIVSPATSGPSLSFPMPDAPTVPAAGDITVYNIDTGKVIDVKHGTGGGLSPEAATQIDGLLGSLNTIPPTAPTDQGIGGTPSARGLSPEAAAQIDELLASLNTVPGPALDDTAKAAILDALTSSAAPGIADPTALPADAKSLADALHQQAADAAAADPAAAQTVSAARQDKTILELASDPSVMAREDEVVALTRAAQNPDPLSVMAALNQTVKTGITVSKDIQHTTAEMLHMSDGDVGNVVAYGGTGLTVASAVLNPTRANIAQAAAQTAAILESSLASAAPGVAAVAGMAEFIKHPSLGTGINTVLNAGMALSMPYAAPLAAMVGMSSAISSWFGGGGGKPIVLDMTGKGINLTPVAQSGAFFDLDGDGVREQRGWIGQGNALQFCEIFCGGV